jgi:hypothetical protein
LAAILRRSVLDLARGADIYEAREQYCFLISGQSHSAGSSLDFVAEEFIVERAVKKPTTRQTNPSLTQRMADSKGLERTEPRQTLT